MNNLLKAKLILAVLVFLIGGLTTEQFAKAQNPTSENEPKKQTNSTKSPISSPSKEAKTPPKTSPTLRGTRELPSEVKEVEPTPVKTEETNSSDNKSKSDKEKGWLDDIGTLLAWLALGLVGLVVLGLTAWFIYYILTNIWNEKAKNAKEFNNLKSDQRELSRQVKQLNETVKLQNDRIERQQGVIQSLQNQPRASNIVQTPQFVEQPVYKPEPQFPVSVENYLNKVRQQGQKASADMIGGLLVQDPNKNEEFLIVKDAALADGLFYAVPSFARFSTKSDYLTYYQHYYACENPSGGTVWILAPTIVQRVADGWKLAEMGELEIRN